MSGSNGQGLVKSWGDVETRIVELFFLIGVPKREVAESVGVPVKVVEKTIKDPRARELVESARQKILEETSQDIKERVGHKVNRLRSKAAEALDRTLSADINPLHKAKPNQDRVALKVLQGTGDLDDKSERETGGITLTEEQFDRLLDGLTKADRVAAMDAPVLDAQVEEEPDDD